jgi:hypothetical protein
MHPNIRFPHSPLAGHSIFGQNKWSQFIGLLPSFNNRKCAFELSFFQGFDEKGTAFIPFLFRFQLVSTLYCGATSCVDAYFCDFHFLGVHTGLKLYPKEYPDFRWNTFWV